MAATVTTMPSATSQSFYSKTLELIETDNSYPISSQQKEIIQAVWLGHLQIVEDLLKAQPTLIDTQFKANIIESRIPKAWTNDIDKYQFNRPEDDIGGKVIDAGIRNLQHLACRKRNLKMTLLIHEKKPTLFFQGTPQLDQSPLEILAKTKDIEFTLGFANFLDNWLNSGTLDNYLFHHHKHLHLADTMIRNSNYLGLKIILNRTHDLYYLDQIKQSLAAPISLPNSIAGLTLPIDIVNLVTSYCQSFPIDRPRTIHCSEIQAKIKALIHPIDQRDAPHPLLHTALCFTNNNIIKLILAEGADPDQPMTITYDDGSTQTYSIRYFGTEEHQKHVQSILEKLGRGTPASHSIRRDTAPILKPKSEKKLKSRACIIS